MNIEENKKNFKNRKQYIIDTYKVEFNDIVNEGMLLGDKYSYINASVALYFATYFNLKY